MNAVRSWLYAPGHRPDLVRKAFATDADAVVVDLEDAVPPERKPAAREGLREILADPRPETWVRINAADTPWEGPDTDLVAAHRPTGIRVPKCEDPEAVRRLGDRLGLPMWLVVETGLGLERAVDLATAHPDVAGLMLGEADLKASLRVPDDRGLGWARGRVVTASAAAGLASPVQSVHTRVDDPAGLRASSEEGRALGFFGRSVIHPRQVDVVNAVFTPSPQDVDRARTVVAALDASRSAGSAAVVDADGTFIDPAVAAQAGWIVDLDHRIRARHA